jgi:hypothetical protein
VHTDDSCCFEAPNAGRSCSVGNGAGGGGSIETSSSRPTGRGRSISMLGSGEIRTRSIEVSAE